MNTEVAIHVTGSQNVDGEIVTIETAAIGKRIDKEEKTYLFFEEKIEDSKESIHCRIEIEEDKVRVVKRGPVNQEQVFCVGEATEGYYQNQYGQMRLEICTERIEIMKGETRVIVKMEYEMNGAGISMGTYELEIDAQKSR